MQLTDIHHLETRVLKRVRERFDPPDDVELIVADRDNGDEDWGQPVHVTVFLPDRGRRMGLRIWPVVTLSTTLWITCLLKWLRVRHAPRTPRVSVV